MTARGMYMSEMQAQRNESLGYLEHFHTMLVLHWALSNGVVHAFSRTTLPLSSLTNGMKSKVDVFKLRERLQFLAQKGYFALHSDCDSDLDMSVSVSHTPLSLQFEQNEHCHELCLKMQTIVALMVDSSAYLY